MKVPASGYSFNAAAKTITFSGRIPASLEEILFVGNCATGQTMLSPGGGAAAVGTYTSPTLTLACDTTGMANGNPLLIVLEDGLTTQAVSNASLGDPADAAATTDTGTFSIPALIKRGLQGLGSDGTSPPTLPNSSSGIRGWLRYMTTLWPTLVSGRWLVDGSGVTQPVSQSGVWTVQPGNTQNTTPWLTRLSDGTNAAAIKAASTAAVAADPALVVAVSPNSNNALETGGNLATLATRTPALGTAAGANSSPVALSVESASGNITTQNLTPFGAATANSSVEIPLLGSSSVSIQVSGGYTGALSVQLTNDGVTWSTITASAIVNAVTSAISSTIASGTTGLFTFNGQGFLRMRVSALGAVTGTATVTLRTTLAPSTTLVLQPTAANLNATVAGTVTANAGTGTLAVSMATNTPTLAAGTNLAGDVGIQYRANATGAATPTNVNCPATPAAQAIKASAGRLLGLLVTNSNASTRWLKVWNTAVGGITMGTTAALFEVALPPGQPVSLNFDGGLAFGTAISIAVTGGQGLTNNTVVTLGDVTGFTVHA